MKRILVTGSSRGIGKAIALKAAEKGWQVIVHGRTDSEQLNKTHAEISRSEKLFFDVSDRAEVEQALAGIEVDVLVNNAGVARNFLKDLAELDDDKAIEEFRTNVLGTLHCTRVLLDILLKNKGVVINIASIKGQANLATMSTLTFAATKAGIISTTKALAKAYPGIRFCSVSPGYIETDQVADWNEQTFERINDGTIMGRIGQPEEVANLVLFLASAEASYITGNDYLVDGGYEIKGK